MLKELKWSSVYTGIAYVVLGVLFIIFPDLSASVISYLIGGGLIIAGIVEMLMFYFMDITHAMFRNEFIIGMVLAVAGLVVIFMRDAIIALIPVLLGLLIVASGVSKLQKAILAKKVGYEGAWSYIILASVSVFLGLLIMFYLSGHAVRDLLFVVIGASLVYSGCSDLYATFFVTKKFHHYLEDQVIDVDAKEHKSDE